MSVQDVVIKRLELIREQVNTCEPSKTFRLNNLPTIRLHGMRCCTSYKQVWNV